MSGRTGRSCLCQVKYALWQPPGKWGSSPSHLFLIILKHLESRTRDKRILFISLVELQVLLGVWVLLSVILFLHSYKLPVVTPMSYCMYTILTNYSPIHHHWISITCTATGVWNQTPRHLQTFGKEWLALRSTAIGCHLQFSCEISSLLNILQ